MGIKVDTVHIHPTQEYHKKIWSKYNYTIVEDSSCVWSDGNIGGYCCEMYVGELEIGNLVNTLEYSVDVGFGFERLVQVIEGKSRVDETSIFNQGLHPIVRDHVRTLELLWNNQIKPGSKNREYICRTLVRRTMKHITTEKFLFDDWIQSERELLEKKLKLGRKVYRRHKDKSEEWWWSTYGILPEELKLIKK